MSWPDSSIRGGWSSLSPGDRVTVVKLAPDGSEAARYPGEVIARVDPESWIVVRATWTHRRIELDGLAFSPGDELREWFSPEQEFNAFAVHAPDGRRKGWYANVTDPAWLETTTAPPLLFWRDLYVDLVGLPDGAFSLRDEDELAASGLARENPGLHGRILRARDEIARRFEHRLAPFADVSHGSNEDR